MLDGDHPKDLVRRMTKREIAKEAREYAAAWADIING
jgi:hypothetical protein